jgi:carboxymethylenebutenolidase
MGRRSGRAGGNMDTRLISLLLAFMTFLGVFAAGCIQEQEPPAAPVSGNMVDIVAGGREYPAYLAAPPASGSYPVIILIHSFNGLEPGYREMSDQLAAEGFVVLAPEWQTYGQSPADGEVEEVINGSLAYLSNFSVANVSRAGLTGFCAGGRYTMLFLPQRGDFRSGVAWYGFPYSRGFANDTTPADHVMGLIAPMLIIHGTRDTASPIDEIYQYAGELDEAGKYFEMKIYRGKGHGFMIVNGSLATDDASKDAYREMSAFFNRTLK